MTEPESLAPYTKFIWISSRESRGSERRWPPGFGVRDERVYRCLFGQRRRHVWSDDATAIGILSWGVSRACRCRFQWWRDIAATDFGSAFGRFGTLAFYAGNGEHICGSHGGNFSNPHGMDQWESHAELLWYKKALTDKW